MKELRVTKRASRQAAWMTRFLRILERWSVHHQRRGYRIELDQADGYATMVWRAVR